MKVINDFNEYKLLDMADGMKLELWNNYKLLRPDPQIIWSNDNSFGSYDAIYKRSNKGGGGWSYKTKIPENWQVKYKNLTFNIKPMGFKHTGLFPEQAVNWDWMINKIKNAKRDIKA